MAKGYDPDQARDPRGRWVKVSISAGLFNELMALEHDTVDEHSPQGKHELKAALAEADKPGRPSRHTVKLTPGAHEYLRDNALPNTIDILRDQAGYEPSRGTIANAAERLVEKLHEVKPKPQPLTREQKQAAFEKAIPKRTTVPIPDEQTHSFAESADRRGPSVDFPSDAADFLTPASTSFTYDEPLDLGEYGVLDPSKPGIFDDED